MVNQMEIKAKLGNMRKEVGWVVYPRPTNVGDDYTVMTIQSDHRLCKFDTKTGAGLLSAHAADYPRIDSKSSFVQVPQDVVDAAVRAQPKTGDCIGGGVYIG